jgi:sigma-B regulation protein RsbU (phosphoserine phosphatase)
VARLAVDSGIDKGMVYPLEPGAITLGRSTNNAIQIIDKRASRHHVEVRLEDGQVFLRDLESKNGTFINGDRLEGEIELNNGDRFRIGDTTVVFERDADDERPKKKTTTVRLVGGGEWGRERSVMDAGVTQARAKETIEAFGGAEEIGAAVKNPTERLRFLYQLSEVIRSTHELDALVDTVMQALAALLQPDRAFLMFADERSGEMKPFAVKIQEGSSEDDEIAISRTIVERCIKDRVSLLIDDALSDQRFKASESIVIQKIGSAICAPMIYQDEVLGVIYLDTKRSAAAYGQEELELATGIANQTVTGVVNIRLENRMIEQRAMELEMEIARDIQMRLLPARMPEVPNYEFSAMSIAAKKVGGDYFDFLELNEDNLGIALADVSGKGVPAAILIASVRSALQAEGLRQGATVTEILEHLNHQVFRDTASNMFVTMVYGVLHPKTSVFEYVNAGHPYPLLFGPSGSLTELETGGCFLGVSETIDYVKGHAVIRPGSTLVVYSDGVTDTMSESEELYGRRRLIELIRDNLRLSAEDLRELIYQSTLEFRGDAEQFDDFTLMVIRNTQSPEE